MTLPTHSKFHAPPPATSEGSGGIFIARILTVAIGVIVIVAALIWGYAGGIIWQQLGVGN